MSVHLDDAAVAEEVVPPAALSLPVWPSSPEPVDSTGRSFLIVELGDSSSVVAERWAAEAARFGPVDRYRASSLDPQSVSAVMAETCCGVRIMVVGPQDGVLRALALARAAGAEPAELRSFVTTTGVLPVFCAHCRATSRVVAEPGGTAACPSCGRVLDIHPHMSAVRGSFLGSDAQARDLR